MSREEIAFRCFQDIFLNFYDTFLLGIVGAFLYMFFRKTIKEKGIRNSLRLWIDQFVTKKEFRGIFALSFYTVLLLYRTVIGRTYRVDCFDDIFSGWGFFASNTKDITDAVQNFILFMPFTFLLLIYSGHRILKENSFREITRLCLKITFFFSLGIEATQGIWRFGTVQLSDLVYNTLGGIVGGWLFYLWKKKRKDEGTE